MTFVHVTRAGLLIRLIQGFRRVGTPVERELAKSGLPTMLEELPHIYGSTAMGWNFVERCMKIEKLDDPGWLTFGDATVDDLRPAFLRSLDGCANVRQALMRFSAQAAYESTYARWSLHPTTDGGVRVCFEHPNLDFVSDISLIELSQVMLAIGLVRCGAGANWRPAQVGFIAVHRFSKEASEFFSESTVCFLQKLTWIAVPERVLQMRLTAAPTGPGVHAIQENLDPRKPITTLRHVLSSYLDERKPSIEHAAEIVSLPVRTLQRRLGENGISFSELVDQCRFDKASAMLVDADNKIIDVALSVGYDDPSHFARAFRRVSGLSPSAYRTALQQGRIVAGLRDNPEKN